MTDSFPSKILLFGEYNLVVGGSGFAVPYAHYSGVLTFEKSVHSKDSNHSLQQLVHFLKSRQVNAVRLDYDRLDEDLAKGLWFDSTIPVGYGLGSSGALIAAIYSKYSLAEETNLTALKTDLAGMESFFHGSSSGIDPLVAYLKKPVVINRNNVHSIDGWSMNSLGFSVYLIDTGMKSKTISLVDWFKTKMKQDRFSEATNHDYVFPIDEVIAQIKKGEVVNFENILAISRYQLEYLSPMVTESFRKHFFAGLESKAFAFKLCGSGGGGFMLCLVSDEPMAEDYFKKNDLTFQKVN